MTIRLYLHRPEIVFAARVNQAEFSYPIAQCDFDTVTTGAVTDIRDNMTVMFGTVEAGSDLGRQRIRKTENSSTVYFGRSSRGTNDGEVDLSDDVYITVLEDYRVWSKTPYITDDGTIYKDNDLVVDDKTDEIPPKANIKQGGFCGTIDSVTNLMTVTFTGENSYSLVSTINTYAWEVEDGTITSNGGADYTEEITATFPAGFRYVTLHVIDGNGKFHTTRVPVYARDPDNDTTIPNFTIDSHSIRKEGQQVSLRVLSDIPANQYPDGTLVMIWEDEATTLTDRNHMIFTGWHHIDPATIRGTRTGITKDTVLECLDVAGKLDTLPGFPISVEGKDTPASWLEMSSPNMDKYIDYIFRWHSTAFGLAEFLPSGTGANYPFVILGSDAQSLFDQAARRSLSLVPDYILGCDTNATLMMEPDPLIQRLADRTKPVQASIKENDYLQLSYTHQRPPRVHWLRSEAVLTHSTNIAALFAVAPDTTPGQGESEQTNGEQLARSQDDLNSSCGNRYSRLNAREGLFSIETTYNVSKFIEPASMEWVSVNIEPETAAQRGLSFSFARGIVHEVNIRYDFSREGLARDVTLQWERETDGLEAQTYIPPDTSFDPGYEPPLDNGYDTEAPPGVGDGFGTVYVGSGDALIRTRDFGATSPSYSDITPPTATSVNDFILDPYNPYENGVLLSDDGVFLSQDMTSASPTWDHVLTTAEMDAIINPPSGVSLEPSYKIIGSINQEGWFGLTSWYARSGGGGVNGALWFIWTDDYGATWYYSQIQSSLFVDYNSYGGLSIVPHIVNSNLVLYASAGVNGNMLFRSLDSGASWNLLGTTISSGGVSGIYVHCPYEGNEAGNIAYFGGQSGNSQEYLFRWDGSGQHDVSPALTNDSGMKKWTAEAYTQNRLLMYSWVYPHDLYESSDGGDVWTQVTTSGLSDTVVGSGGFPYDSGLFYAITNLGDIMVSTDRGQNWTSKTGDSSLTPGANAYYKTVIVPLWLAE